MPDLSITKVVQKGSSQPKTVQIGEAVAQWDLLYLNSADNKHYKADALTAEKSDAVVMAFQDGAIDEWIVVVPLTAVLIVTLATGSIVEGTQYVVSATGGLLAPKADLTSGQYVTHAFLGSNTTDETLPNLNATGITVA